MAGKLFKNAVFGSILKIKVTIPVLLGLLCFGYGGAVFGIRSGGRFYYFWGLCGAAFIVLAVMNYFKVWDKLPKSVRKVILTALITGVIIFAFVQGIILSYFGSEGGPGLDYIIVLGAQVKEEGPSSALKYRLDKAYDYLVVNEDTMCIVSGGQGYNEPFSEALGMRDYLVGRGIDADRIIMEDKSTDTSENIAYSSVFINKDSDSVGIVSNNFHVFRGVSLAKHMGIKNICGIAADSDAFFLINNMVREFFGILKDLACGNLI